MAIYKKWQQSDPDVIDLRSANIYEDIRETSFFEEHTGNEQGNIVNQKVNFGKGDGDTIKFTMINSNETDEGFTGNITIEGKEGKISRSTDSLTIKKRSNAYRFDVDELDVYAFTNIPVLATKKLTHWGSLIKDRMIFSALNASLSAAQTLYADPDNNSAVDDLAIADKITPDLIYRAHAIAKSTNNGAKPKLHPIMINSQEHYILLVSPMVAYDLKQNSDYEQMQREAQMRGKDNPLFTGALVIIDNIIIKEHERVGMTTNASGVHYSKNLLLGQDAIGIGYGKNPELVEKKFDYDNEIGVAYKMWLGVKRMEFTFKTGASSTADFAWGVNHVITACSNLY